MRLAGEGFEREYAASAVLASQRPLGSFFAQCVPIAASLAFALPAAKGGTAVLANKGGLAAGHDGWRNCSYRNEELYNTYENNTRTFFEKSLIFSTLRSAAVSLVTAVIALSEVDQDVIANGARRRSQSVDTDVATDQSNHVAASHRMIRERGDIDREQIHRDTPSQRAAIAGNDRVSSRRVVRGARRAGIAVGIARRDHCNASCVLGGPDCIVPNGLPFLHRAYLHHARPKFDHRTHRVAVARSRINAEECGARAHHVTMGRTAEEDAGRIRQRAWNAAVEDADLGGDVNGAL